RVLDLSARCGGPGAAARRVHPRSWCSAARGRAGHAGLLTVPRRSPEMTEQPQKFETLTIHAGQSPDTDAGSRALPIHQTTSYVFPSTQSAADRFALTEPSPLYTRITNPTQAVLEDHIPALHGSAPRPLLASGHSRLNPP